MTRNNPISPLSPSTVCLYKQQQIQRPAWLELLMPMRFLSYNKGHVWLSSLIHVKSDIPSRATCLAPDKCHLALRYSNTVNNHTSSTYLTTVTLSWNPQIWDYHRWTMCLHCFIWINLTTVGRFSSHLLCYATCTVCVILPTIINKKLW